MFSGLKDDDSSDSSGSSEEEQRNVNFRRQLVEESSDEEEEKRVVRTQKDKKWEAIATQSNNIKNKLKIQDFVSVLDHFEEMNKQLSKVQNIVAAEGVPTAYVRTLVRLEEEVASITREQQKRMNTNNSKSLNKLKSQLKKNNVNYEEDIKKFRENPVESEESQQEESDFSESEESEPSESEESESGSESESEEEERGEDPMTRRRFWMIKPGKEQKETQKTEEEKPKAPKAKPKEKGKETTTGEPVKAEFTPGVISTKVQELTELRGKKPASKELVDTLRELLSYSVEPQVTLQILYLLIFSQFEMVKNKVTVVMAQEVWVDQVSYINQVLDLYEKSPQVFLTQEEDKVKTLVGFLASSLERLNEELKKAFNTTEPQNPEYLTRLKDQIQLTKLSERVFKVYESKEDKENLGRVCLIKIDHLYYVHEDLLKQMRETENSFTEEPREEIERLVKIINEGQEKQRKVTAALKQSYHHSIHQRFAEAKQALLKAEIDQEALKEPYLQVLYNRTLVQLGLAAFCNGFITAAFGCLNEIVSTHKLRELLGQTVIQPSKEKSTTTEKEQRKRLTPYHMHIKNEVVESVFFISAMLIDIPRMAQNPQDPYKNIVSAYFQKMMEYHENVARLGPPENYRDLIVEAADKLRKGNWEETYTIIYNLDFWKHIHKAQEVKEKLSVHFKKSALATFILKYSRNYVFTKQQLSEKFKIEKEPLENCIEELRKEGLVTGEWKDGVFEISVEDDSRVEFLTSIIKTRTSDLDKFIEHIRGNQGFLTRFNEEMNLRKPPAAKRKNLIEFRKA